MENGGTERRKDQTNVFVSEVCYNEQDKLGTALPFGVSPMPLLDHFHPPLLGHRQWEGFHGWWAAAIASRLNEHLLPPEYFAEFQVTLGTRVEVEVGTFTEDGVPEPEANGGGTAVQMLTWAPPIPVAVAPAVFADDFEVQVFNNAAGPTLVAAIELV